MPEDKCYQTPMTTRETTAMTIKLRKKKLEDEPDKGERCDDKPADDKVAEEKAPDVEVVGIRDFSKVRMTLVLIPKISVLQFT